MDLIERLGSGVWLFDELFPPFLEKLSASPRLAFLKGRRVAPFVTTLSYYKLLEEKEILSALDLGAFDGPSPEAARCLDVWQRLTKTVKDGCAPCVLDPEGKAELLSSWTRLSELEPEHGREFAKAVTALVPVTAPTFGAGSSPRLFGCVFVTPQWIKKSFEDRMTSLVHELAHQELFLINLTDRLVNSSADYSLAHAPLQGTERPPIGRLHSAHALFRMRLFQKKVGWKYADSEAKLTETCRSFREGELTPFAREMVAAAYSR